jgi:hypothetical protein
MAPRAHTNQIWVSSKYINGSLVNPTKAGGDCIVWDAVNSQYVHESRALVVHTHAMTDVTGLISALSSKLDTSLKGIANGLAELDSNGFVKNTQLPSYVDDVIECANYAALPETGEAGKIYVTTDDNKTYRWAGTTYAIISDTLALGENYATAYRGDRGKIAYDYSQVGHVTLADSRISAWNAAYTHSQLADGSNPHATTFDNIGSKPTTVSGYGITDVYTKTESDNKFSLIHTHPYLSDSDTRIANWTAAYNTRIASFTVTGNSGAATFTGNTLNIPTYTLTGLGGQPQLNGTGFVKASGTTISYDNTAYLPLANVSGTTNYLVKITGANTVGNSQIIDNGTNVSIGASNPATDSKLYLGYPTTYLSGFNYGIRNVMNATANVDGTTDVRGMSTQVVLTGTSSAAALSGLSFDVYNQASSPATVNIVNAITSSVRITGTSNSNGMYGYRIIPILTSSGNATEYRGFEAKSPSCTSTGVITTAYGFFAAAHKVTGVTSAYGFYQQGSSDLNYFAGATTIANTITATQFKLSALNTAPASATAPGTLGEIRITAGYIYVCTATNTWVRSALATW